MAMAALDSKLLKWIMLVSGALTVTMIYAAIAPQAALRSTFGETLEGPLAEIVVRTWGAMVALVGALLIHGALNAATRKVALVAAASSKAFFVAMLLIYGGQLAGRQVLAPIVVDGLEVIVFVVFLFAGRLSDRPVTDFVS